MAAENRTEFGKGAARRVRRANKVPAVLYGHGEDPRHLSLPGHELMLALKHDANVLLALQTDDGEQLALPKVVVRDPLKGYLEHVDLVAVRKGEKVSVEVPIHLVGDAAPETLVDQQTMTLTVEAEATNLPDHLTVSIEGLSAGGSVTVGEMELPRGTTSLQAADHVVVQGLAVVSEAQLESELAAAEEELGAGQAGAEALAAEQAEGVEQPAAPGAEGDSPTTEGSESDKTGGGDVVTGSGA